jgi:hypothetical protein
MLLVRSLYFSDASPLRIGDIDAILDTARRTNASLNITGVLVIDRGRFMQVLEGGRDAVGGLLLRIAADPRHRNMKLADFSEVSERRYHSWSMGYADAQACSAPVRLTEFDPAPADALYRQIDSYMGQTRYAA